MVEQLFTGKNKISTHHSKINKFFAQNLKYSVKVLKVTRVRVYKKENMIGAYVYYYTI